jgi:hypothetical protein
MSPKRISNLALIVAGISVLGIMGVLVFKPGRGLLTWLPVMGLGFSFVLLAVALIKGALLAAQQQVDLVETMNDCYAGVLDREHSES